MWTALAGLPGKITTLLNRLSDARATKLDSLDATVSSRMPGTTTHRDRIDAAISSRMPGTVTEQARIDTTISSRAPASTALSNATWSDTRAGYVDTTISSRAPASTALSNADYTATRAGYLDKLLPLTLPPIAGGIAHGALASGEPQYSAIVNSPPYLKVQRTTTGTTAVVSITGKGVLNFCAFAVRVFAGIKTFSGTAQVIIDGVTFSVPISATSGSSTETWQSFYFAGGANWVMDQIPFHTSLVINIIQTSGSNNGLIDCVYKYRQVA